MRRSKQFGWLCGLSLVVFLILVPQPSYSAGSLQSNLTKTDDLSSNELHTLSAPKGEESAYTLRPLASSAQDSPQDEAGQSYLGLNPAQALRIEFAPNGLDISAQPSGEVAWRLGLQLESYTRAGMTDLFVAAASTTVAENRIQYHYETVSEWYINDEYGLKQGFTLSQPPTSPTADAPLQLRLQVDGNLRPSLSSDGQSIDFVTESGAALLRYDGLYVFDAQQNVLPAFFSVTASGIAINVDDRGALYPLTIDPLFTSYLVKRTATDAAANDFLGYDVNVSQSNESSSIAIVGVYGDNNEQGVAYVFEQNKGGSNQWGERAKLITPDGAAGDQFGKDVYITFGTTVTVGAPGAEGGKGATYLFAKDRGGANAWGQLTKLTASNGAAGDGFGAAVSVQQLTAVVGAPASDSKGDASGAVYIFEPATLADPTTWSERKIVTAPDGGAGDSFGTALVISGDYLVVGAPGDDDACPQNPACDSGAIYIFARNQGGPNQWGLLHKRTAVDGAAGDLFGSSLNFSTDRVIVGAPGDDEKGSNAGAAYIFERNRGGDNAWNARPKIMAPEGAANDQFGRSVGIGGNIAIIGAPFDDDSGESSGAAYLLFYRFSGGQGEWSQAVKVIASDGASGDQFGYSVDQRSGRIVIGAPMESDGGDHAGAVYFYNTPFSVSTLQIANNVEPNDPDTNWNYTVEGLLTHSESATGDSQTSPVILFPGIYTITESAGVNTDVSQYVTSWSCTNNGAPGASGIGTTANFTIDSRQNVVCNFTHISPGTIVVKKQTEPAGGTGFVFTDTVAPPNSFTLDDDGSKTFDNVGPGTYQVAENVPSGWRVTAITCPDSDGGTSTSETAATIDLDAGEAMTCTFTNKAKEGISIIKSANLTIASVGQTITYTYRVINDSQVDLTNVVATDDKLGNVPLGKTTLAPNEETTGILAYTAQESDLSGTLVNTVAVSGTPPSGPVVTDSTSLSIVVAGSASITMSVRADPLVADVDDMVTYSYSITNTGLTPLVNVKVTDDRLGEVPLIDTSLQPGESTSGTLLYTVLESDLPGPLTDTATAIGTPPAGADVESEATVTVALGEVEETLLPLYLPVISP